MSMQTYYLVLLPSVTEKRCIPSTVSLQKPPFWAAVMTYAIHVMKQKGPFTERLVGGCVGFSCHTGVGCEVLRR